MKLFSARFSSPFLFSLSLWFFCRAASPTGLSGTIAGGAETFFGKSKAQTLDKKLSVVTTVVAVVFVALVLCVYVMQDVDDVSGIHSDYVAPVTDTVTDGADSDTAAVTDADTAAATDADTAAATDADSAADTAATAAE